MLQIQAKKAEIEIELGPKVTLQKMDMDKMVMVIVGIFVFCNSFQILNYFFKNNIVECIADFFLTFNSSINAIVYGIYQKKYQEILLSTVPKCGVSHTDSVIYRP